MTAKGCTDGDERLCVWILFADDLWLASAPGEGDSKVEAPRQPRASGSFVCASVVYGVYEK